MSLTFSSGPLAGRTVAVTRARAQASEMARRLRALGARVIEAPVIRIAPLPVEVAQVGLGGFDLVCLTSPNGVRLLFEALDAAGLDARALAGAKVAVIGPGTSRALAGHGIREIVIKEGSNGAFIRSGANEFHVPVPERVSPLDTNAAGDSFNAGYLAARCKGASEQEAALAGHRLAAKVITHRGAIIPAQAMAGG